jgi:beta-fructofuranosidase
VVLEPSAPGNWDDLAIWTGSVARGDDGTWRMYYTAVSQAGQEAGTFDQRVGVVESDDLYSWRRVQDKPCAEVDNRWYRTKDYDGTVTETWRDPQVFRVDGDSKWHMLVCARAKVGEPWDDGVIAHATSDDMINWEVGPPISEPGGGFSQIEVAQVRQIDGEWVLAFTCHPQEQNTWRKEKSGRGCTWSLTGPGPLGPWDITKAEPFRAESDLFAAPLLQRRDGSWCFIGFRCLEPEGQWTFYIIDPVPVVLDGNHLEAAAGYPTFDSPAFHLGT